MANRTVEERLSPEQLAQRLSISLSFCRKLIRRGVFGRVEKLGPKCIRIPAGAVNRYLESVRV